MFVDSNQIFILNHFSGSMFCLIDEMYLQYLLLTILHRTTTWFALLNSFTTNIRPLAWSLFLVKFTKIFFPHQNKILHGVVSRYIMELRKSNQSNLFKKFWIRNSDRLKSINLNSFANQHSKNCKCHCYSVVIITFNNDVFVNYTPI